MKTQPAPIEVPAIRAALPVLRRPRLPFSPWHLLLVPLALVFAAPLVWLLLSSVMSNAEINRFPPALWPSRVDFSGYRYVLENALFLRWIGNSLIVSAVTVVSNLLFGALGGYAFARMRFAGSRALLALMVATMAIPFQLTMIPTFLVMKKLGLIDSLGALIVPSLVTPFAVFLLRQFFLSLPRDLDNAARIDGASELRVFLQIVLPNARPALLTLGLFTFVNNWNDLLWPLIFTTDRDMGTLTSGLTLLTGPGGIIPYGVMMAGSLVAILPLIVAFVLVQRKFIASMATAGLK